MYKVARKDNLVELVDILQNIDENAPAAKMNSYSMLDYRGRGAKMRTYFAHEGGRFSRCQKDKNMIQ